MTETLLLSAAVLGWLGFFEPCTIATHALFAVRANRSPARWRDLGLLAAARALVLATLFAAAAALGLSGIASHTAAAILFMLGAIYLLTIKVYLPVPHIEFQRLLPGGATLREPLQLGLTLPACTLPLIGTIGLLAAISRDVPAAILAGILFALALTAPTIWYSARGTSVSDRELLGRAAHLSHYVTALLFWGGALGVLLTQD